MRGVAYDPVFRAKLMAMHQQGVTFMALSAEFGVAREVLSRWWARYQVEDLPGLQPRSRRPHTSPSQISPGTQRRILALRQRRMSAARISHAVGVGHGTTQRILEAHGVNQLPQPPKPRPKRFEKQRPGELVHIDFKYLPALRNARHDFEFAAVDDFSREAVVWITTESTSAAATTFLERVARALPYPIEAVLTDNAFAFTMRHALHAERRTRFQ